MGRPPGRVLKESSDGEEFWAMNEAMKLVTSGRLDPLDLEWLEADGEHWAIGKIVGSVDRKLLISMRTFAITPVSKSSGVTENSYTSKAGIMRGERFSITPFMPTEPKIFRAWFTRDPSGKIKLTTEGWKTFAAQVSRHPDRIVLAWVPELDLLVRGSEGGNFLVDPDYSDLL